MVKRPHGSWRFAAETVDDPRIKALYSEIKTRYEKLSRADMEGDTFQQDLMSPSGRIDGGEIRLSHPAIVHGSGKSAKERFVGAGRDHSIGV
jgi:hypothetical protein